MDVVGAYGDECFQVRSIDMRSNGSDGTLVSGKSRVCLISDLQDTSVYMCINIASIEITPPI